ncbi:MAG: pyruvate, phosphate dikinase [Rhodobiaceae bacterium]|nr:pyruvate, phosphate dikinase [Rhodobiaceae bacterium]
MTKYIHAFSDPLTDEIDQSLIGNKGYNLCLMHGMDLPIPEGFIINAKATKEYKIQNDFSDKFLDELENNLAIIQDKTNLQIGNPEKPLILSVRSGSMISMPGMLDTILNVGLNHKIVKTLAKNNNGFFAYDTWRRFIQMYSHVVHRLDTYDFDEILENYLLGANLSAVSQLDAEDLEEICKMYLDLFKERVGEDFPEDPYQQINESIVAVLNSWDNERAISYRNINDIPNNIGLAVTIQRMVFGNLNDKSASGVIFSRNPDTGEDKIKGEYLLESQGEDVVSGFITPKNISETGTDDMFTDIFSDIYKQINQISKNLEKQFGFVQDIEFTIESNVLWILQSRNAELNAQASFKVLRDFVDEKIINQNEALKLIKEDHVEKAFVPVLDDSQELKILTKGLPASPGVISGLVVFDIEGINRIKNRDEKSILILVETNTNDIKAMHASDGILTSRGGLTSHAAVVARGLNKPCITGAVEIKINTQKKNISINNKIISEFDTITLDGHSGEVIDGIVKTIPQEPSSDLKEILNWCKKIISDKDIADSLKIIKQAKLKLK